MTKEEAWLAWMETSKTTDTPIESDFELIKKTSWWQAFEAGWDLASVNLNGWDQAYAMGFEAGKEVAEPANSTTDFVEPKISSQTEQEPVAWVIEDGEVDYYVDVVAKIKPGTPLYTAPPKREVWCDCGDGIMPNSGAKCGNCIAAESASREWDGPTDEEYENFCSLIQREEAKLKEKNT